MKNVVAGNGAGTETRPYRVYSSDSGFSLGHLLMAIKTTSDLCFATAGVAPQTVRDFRKATPSLVISMFCSTK